MTSVWSKESRALLRLEKLPHWLRTEFAPLADPELDMELRQLALWLETGDLKPRPQRMFALTAFETAATHAARGYPPRASGADRDDRDRTPLPDQVARDQDRFHPTGLSDRTGDTATTPNREAGLYHDLTMAVNSCVQALIVWSTKPGDPSLCRGVRRRVDRLRQLVWLAHPRPGHRALNRQRGDVAEGGCQACARHGHYCPEATPTPVTVAGNLAAPQVLCDFCTRQVRDLGVLPSKKLMEAHERQDKTEVARLRSEYLRNDRRTG